MPHASHVTIDGLRMRGVTTAICFRARSGDDSGVHLMDVRWTEVGVCLTLMSRLDMRRLRRSTSSNYVLHSLVMRVITKFDILATRCFNDGILLLGVSWQDTSLYRYVHSFGNLSRFFWLYLGPGKPRFLLKLPW